MNEKEIWLNTMSLMQIKKTYFNVKWFIKHYSISWVFGMSSFRVLRERLRRWCRTPSFFFLQLWFFLSNFGFVDCEMRKFQMECACVLIYRTQNVMEYAKKTTRTQQTKTLKRKDKKIEANDRWNERKTTSTAETAAIRRQSRQQSEPSTRLHIT